MWLAQSSPITNCSAKYRFQISIWCCDQVKNIFLVSPKEIRKGHKERKPWRITSMGPYWGWFPVMQCRQTSRGGRSGTDSSESPSQIISSLYLTLAMHSFEARDKTLMVSERQIGGNLLICSFSFEHCARQQWKTMIGQGLWEGVEIEVVSVKWEKWS